jgi:hypothetical protein
LAILGQEPSFVSRLFRAAESRRISEVRAILDTLGKLLKEGLPRLVDQSSPVTAKEVLTCTLTQNTDISANAQLPNITIGTKIGDSERDTASS